MDKINESSNELGLGANHVLNLYEIYIKNGKESLDKEEINRQLGMLSTSELYELRKIFFNIFYDTIDFRFKKKLKTFDFFVEVMKHLKKDISLSENYSHYENFMRESKKKLGIKYEGFRRRNNRSSSDVFINIIDKLSLDELYRAVTNSTYEGLYGESEELYEKFCYANIIARKIKQKIKEKEEKRKEEFQKTIDALSEEFKKSPGEIIMKMFELIEEQNRILKEIKLENNSRFWQIENRIESETKEIKEQIGMNIEAAKSAKHAAHMAKSKILDQMHYDKYGPYDW